MHLQQNQGRNHGDKNTDKQLSYFFNRFKGEVIDLSYSLAGCLHGQERCCQDDNNFYQSGKREYDFIIYRNTGSISKGREHLRKQAVKYYPKNDKADVNQVMYPLNADRFLYIPCIRRTASCQFLLIHAMVDEVEHREENHQIQYENRQHMECPGEGNSTLESHEQRRIAQRSKAAAHVGYQEDEEYDDMHLILTPFISPDNWTDHDHSRPGSSNPAGQECPYKEKQGVHFGSACQSASHRNTSSHHKQAEKQNNKRNIVKKHRFQQPESCFSHAIGYCKRHQECHRPGNSHTQHVFGPPFRFNQRNNGNRKQHACKRDYTPHRKCLSHHFMHTFIGKYCRCTGHKQGQCRK